MLDESVPQEAAVVRVAENGRLSLPAKHRKAVGLSEGGMVVVRVEDGELRVRPVQAVIADIQAIARKHLKASGDSVDRFLADRREEAVRE